MFVLDTNVLSEVTREDGASSVLRWTDSISRTDIFTTSITQGEILYGIELLAAGSKRSQLAARFHAVFSTDLAGRILPFDSRAAAHYADIAASRRRAGRRMDAVDAQIGGIVRSRGMVLVTRNVKDFEDCGIEVVNPWTAGR